MFSGGSRKFLGQLEITLYAIFITTIETEDGLGVYEVYGVGQLSVFDDVGWIVVADIHCQRL